MAIRSRTFEARLIQSKFDMFVRHAFRRTHGNKLGNQPYVEHMCFVISQLIDGDIKRLLINLPPQHLKSFVGTVCLAAYLLGRNPHLRIIVVAYNDAFAETLCGRIRDMMQTKWYRDAFETRIKHGHSRTNDFATPQNGGVFAVSATGSITGRSADFIIYDDPHEIGDWDDDRKLRLVCENFNTVLSRLSDKVRGRVIVIAHRLSSADLSSMLLNEKGWQFLRLPLEAIKTRTYELGHDEWVRVKGNILQPKAYPKAELERLRRTQLAPPFDLFYQQGVGPKNTLRAHVEDFQTFGPHERPIAPVVLSIDPGYGGGLDASRSVIQAWVSDGGRHYLMDEFCEQCDAEQLRKAFWLFVRKYRPGAALIEKTANGPALYAAVRQKVRFDIKLVVPRHEPKAARLKDHLPKIRSKRIFLPEDAPWREAFIEEIVNFPADFDDRCDAMTQYLDFMDTKPIVSVPEQRGTMGIAYARPW